MLFPHIRKDVRDHSDGDNRKQFNNNINTLSHGIPEDNISITQDIFWTEYTELGNKNGSFDVH